MRIESARFDASKSRFHFPHGTERVCAVRFRTFSASFLKNPSPNPSIGTGVYFAPFPLYTPGATAVPPAITHITTPPTTTLHRHRGVRNTRLSFFCVRPHSGQVIPLTPAMSYQHVGHRRRPRERSRKSAKAITPSAIAASTPPAHQLIIVQSVVTASA